MGAIQVDQDPAVVPDALGEVGVGSVVLLGNSTGGADAVSTAVNRAVAVAGEPAGVEPLVAADQEGGEVQRLKGPGFDVIPSAIEQSGMSAQELRDAARTWGEQVHAAGVNMNLAPVADVVPASVGNQNEPIGALQRGYGADASDVSRSVAAFVRGMADAGVATSIKHFPGLGKVIGNTDFSSEVIDSSTTRDDPDLAPFRNGVSAGAQFVMVALATYAEIDPDHRAVFSSTVIDGMIRDDLGFDGVVVSDDLGAAKAVSDVPAGERALRFLRAGGDLVLVATAPALLEMTSAVFAEAEADTRFRAQVEQSAHRVLTAKERLGLLPCSPGR